MDRSPSPDKPYTVAPISSAVLKNNENCTWHRGKAYKTRGVYIIYSHELGLSNWSRGDRASHPLCFCKWLQRSDGYRRSERESDDAPNKERCSRGQPANRLRDSASVSHRCICNANSETRSCEKIETNRIRIANWIAMDWNRYSDQFYSDHIYWTTLNLNLFQTTQIIIIFLKLG